MPRGDRTGRFGFGPMSGRGFGYCAGYRHPGYMGGGRGFGRGMGMGFGRGFGYSPPYMPEPISEREALSAQARNLEEQLSFIKERLKALEEGQEG